MISNTLGTWMKGAVVGECYRMCKPSECTAAEELLIQVEGRKIAEVIQRDCKTIMDEILNDSMYIEAIIRRSVGSKDKKFHCNKNAKKTSVKLAWPKNITWR